MKTFAEHLHNTAKKLQEDEDTGFETLRIREIGADHFRHPKTMRPWPGRAALFSYSRIYRRQDVSMVMKATKTDKGIVAHELDMERHGSIWPCAAE